MSGELYPVEETARLGPHMAALSPRMRQFVYALIQTGCSQAKAAELAGYQGGPKTWKTMGWKLAHDPRVQAAIHEEAQKLLRSTSIMAIGVISDIARNPEAEAKDRLRAAVELLNRSGLHAQSEHKVVVERTPNDAEVISQIRSMAGRLGIDADKLLGRVAALPAPIDVEFEVIDGGDEWTIQPGEVGDD